MSSCGVAGRCKLVAHHSPESRPPAQRIDADVGGHSCVAKRDGVVAGASTAAVGVVVVVQTET